MNRFVDDVILALLYLVSCFILFFVGRLVYKVVHRKINVKEELVIKDNFAFSLSQLGYYTGLLLSIGGAVMGPSGGIVADLVNIGIYGMLAIILLNVSLLINDAIILRKFSVFKEIIHDKNAGTGVVEGASAVATGLIILGSVYGEGGGIETALVFWLVGQFCLIIASFVYNALLSYDIHAQIEKDNVAVGVGFAGMLVGVGNLIRHAIMHDFMGWKYTFIQVGVTLLVGLAILPFVRILTDKILLPGSKLTHEMVNQDKPNVGAALFEAFAYIGGSVLISWCF